MGVVIFAVIAGVITVAAAVAYYRHAIKKARAIWEPNREILNGEFAKGRIGLRAMYNGVPVFARIESAQEADSNGTSLSNDDMPATRTTYNYALSLTLPLNTQEDWKICFTGKGLLNRKEAPRWRVSAKHAELIARLESAGVLDSFQQGWPANATVSYKAKKNELTMRYPVDGQYYCPDTDLFRRQLETMQDIAAKTSAAVLAI